jgi:diphosphomevalonate decarboxylase
MDDIDHMDRMDDMDRMVEENSFNTTPGTSRARALANLALVKYFGKRDLALNLPAAPSLSVTLEPLATTTAVTFDPGLSRDAVQLNGESPGDAFCTRVIRFLDIVRDLSGVKTRAIVQTENSFPTAAGLASSASGFAALSLAATRALGITLDDEALSALARRGSGSAARSVPGGFSVWRRGEASDGSDSFANAIAGPDDLDLRVLVGVTDPGPKAMGSSQAMEETRLTSPYYTSWIDAVHRDLEAAEKAVETRDVEALGEVAERNALAMHACALAARPGILFWNGTTLEAVHLVRRLRSQGHLVYFTCDAGPQPKLLCTKEHEQAAAAALSSLPGVTRLIHCRPGLGVRVDDR